MKFETLDELIDRMEQDCRAEIEKQKMNADSETEIIFAEKYTRQSIDETKEER